MLLAQLPLCLPEEGGAQKGGQRQQLPLDYLRKNRVHQASMESVASMDDDAGAHGVVHGQGRNVYTRERNFSGNPKTYRQHEFRNVQSALQLGGC